MLFDVVDGRGGVITDDVGVSMRAGRVVEKVGVESVVRIKLPGQNQQRQLLRASTA